MSHKVRIEVPHWWPPKVGDKIRMYDLTDEGAIARLCHVVSVFRHDQKQIAVVAFYGIHKQWWHYEVVRALEASWKYWPDGAECPNETLAENLRKYKERQI